MTLEKFWQSKSNRELELAARQIAEYTEEAQQIIRAEAEKRGIPTSPIFTRSDVQRDPSLLGNLLEKSRLDRFDTTAPNGFLRRVLGITGKTVALVFTSLGVVLLFASGKIILPLIIVTSLLYAVYRAVAYRNCYLLFYERGVVYEQPNEKRVAYYDELQVWQAIVQLHYGFVPIGGETEEYTLKFPDGERVAIYQGSIGKRLQMLVTQHQLPQAFEIYEQGNDVLFDSAICLNKQGINVNGETVKWSDLNRVDIIRGTIHIYRTGDRFAVTNVPMSAVPNVYVFLNLLERLGYYKPEPVVAHTNGSVRGDDLRLDLEISFYEAIFGGEKEIRFSHLEASPDNRITQVTKSLKITIPAGVSSETRLRLAGEGDASRSGGATGDLYVCIIAPSEDGELRRDGISIKSEIRIAKEQARLGGEVFVRTIDGRTKIAISPGTKHGDCLTLQGCGVPKLGSASERGDHVIHFIVEAA